MDSFPVLVNLFFALLFWVLIGTFGWEIRVKINHRAKRILLSKPQTFKNNILVVNLVQMLVSFALISTVKMSKVSIFPGHDYLIFCFCCFSMKILQLRKESLFLDTIGLLPLLLLISSLITSVGSILQSSSIFFNWILFFLPFPVIATAFVSISVSILEISSIFSLFSVISTASALFVMISVKKFRSIVVLLALLLALKYMLKSDLKQDWKSKNLEETNSHKIKSPIFEYEKEPDFTGENWKSNPIKYSNISLKTSQKEVLEGQLKNSAYIPVSKTPHLVDVCLKFKPGNALYLSDKDPQDKSFGGEEVIDMYYAGENELVNDNLEYEVVPNAALIYSDNKTGDENLVEPSDNGIDEVFYDNFIHGSDVENQCKNNNFVGKNQSSSPTTGKSTPSDNSNEILEEKIILENHDHDNNLNFVKVINEIRPEESKSSKVPNNNINVNYCQEETKQQNNNYFIFKSELDSFDQCSIEALGLSETNFTKLSEDPQDISLVGVEVSDMYVFGENEVVNDNLEFEVGSNAAVIQSDNKTGDEHLVEPFNTGMDELFYDNFTHVGDKENQCKNNNFVGNNLKKLNDVDQSSPSTGKSTPSDDINEILVEKILLENHDHDINFNLVKVTDEIRPEDETPEESKSSKVPKNNMNVNNCQEESNQQDNNYFIFKSELDSSDQCSVEALDMSESNFLLKNFVQFNHFFNKIFPSFPSYLPFQLKKISLLGFSHLCLSLPGSEVSLINLGVTEEKGGNLSNGGKCNCEEKSQGNMAHQFSVFIVNLKKFFTSLL
eukprot:TRINITY_DN9370_c0_g1_i4.p1 TRINITY_DN9370_c0_g1~~TRINITY_DN9370_c0_g1_i4.p1  ORF type:complete len:781 (-),score=158.05 TRINITY_DN9370_c0_g1_i4:42-2384(-)